jgi:hypothetical protein
MAAPVEQIPDLQTLVVVEVVQQAQVAQARREVLLLGMDQAAAVVGRTAGLPQQEAMA